MFGRHCGTDAVLLLGPIDEAGPDRAQAARLRACGAHVSRDASSIGDLTASLVECPWLPFD